MEKDEGLSRMCFSQDITRKIVFQQVRGNIMEGDIVIKWMLGYILRAKSVFGVARMLLEEGSRLSNDAVRLKI